MEVIIVDDNAIQYPVLLGHTFTERPNIVITKTLEQIIFEKISERKLFLMIQQDTVIHPNHLGTIPVETRISYIGQVYINGTVRGNIGKEYFLLPEEYTLNNGTGRLLIQNICENLVVFLKGALFTRAIPTISVREVCSTSLDASLSNFNDASIHCDSQLTSNQKLELRNLLAEYRDCFSFRFYDGRRSGHRI